MSLSVDENGTITLYQGDTGEVVINGLKDDNNYRVYFAIQDEKRNPVGEEVMVNSNYQSSVCFNLPASVTDLLEVPRGKAYRRYYWGVKLVTPGTLKEDTLFVGGSNYGDLNQLIVYPKKVEGVK